MITPIIRDIANDRHAALYGIQPWERDYLLTRCFKDRTSGGVAGRVEAIALHIQDGFTHGSLDWWVHGKRNGKPIEASATVMANLDGSILNVIPEIHGPWTNGDVNKPSPQSRGVRQLGGNPNLWCVTCEAEGRPWSGMPEVQLEAIAWWVDDVMRRHPNIDLELDVMGHLDFNSVDRSQCGLYVPQVKARLRGDNRPKPGSYGTIVPFSSPIRVLVTAPRGVNVRKWGDLDSPIQTALAAGTEFFASGYVYGDAVDKENRWYILTGSKLRVWSGATNKPMLP